MQLIIHFLIISSTSIIFRKEVSCFYVTTLNIFVINPITTDIYCTIIEPNDKYGEKVTSTLIGKFNIQKNTLEYSIRPRRYYKCFFYYFTYAPTRRFISKEFDLSEVDYEILEDLEFTEK